MNVCICKCSDDFLSELKYLVYIMLSHNMVWDLGAQCNLALFGTRDSEK